VHVTAYIFTATGRKKTQNFIIVMYTFHFVSEIKEFHVDFAEALSPASTDMENG
jgi:hypothetical protein